MSTQTTYKSIFKSTFLFGFVQVINIVVRVIFNKAAAILLGTHGMGIIGIYYSVVDLFRSICGLGVSQSAVRDVSEAYASNDIQRFSKIIVITKRLILFTGLLGAFATMALSYNLSQWSFGSGKFTLSFVWLGFVVFINIINESQLAIIKGMRQLNALAKATIFSSVIGLIFGIPLYYFFKEDGIIPALIIVGLSALGFSWHLVNNVNYQSVAVSKKETITGSAQMIKLGVALTYITFLGSLSNYILRSYIAEYGSLSQVGIFQAGSVILNSYFAIVLTALNTDYYPRMYAVANDNIKMQHEVNVQITTAFLMITPIFVFFIFALPLFIRVLYTNEFLEAILYLKYAIFGTIFNLYADTLGVVLIAKQQSKVFVVSVTVSKLITIPTSIMGYYYWGFSGFGIATLVCSIINLIIVQTIITRKYNISYTKYTYRNIGICLVFCFISLLVFSLPNIYLKYTLGTLLLIICGIFTIKKLKNLMGIDVKYLLTKKLFK